MKKQLISVFAVKTASGVKIYRDKNKQSLFCNFDKFSARQPRRGQKTVVLNCWRWSLVWLPANIITN